LGEKLDFLFLLLRPEDCSCKVVSQKKMGNLKAFFGFLNEENKKWQKKLMDDVKK